MEGRPLCERRILVTGGKGRLGTELGRQHPGLILAGRDELDVTDYGSVLFHLRRIRPDVIIHAAGITDLARIEKDHAEADLVHVEGTRHIVLTAATIGAKVVYTSTDYVFDGEKPGGLYREDDPVSPVSHYAKTKVESEMLVLSWCSSALVVRGTMKPAGVWKHPRAPTDMWQSFESVEDYARRLLTLIHLDARGIFHIGGPRQNTFEYARSVRPDVTPCLRADLAAAFTLPKDVSLDCRKYETTVAGKLTP